MQRVHAALAHLFAGLLVVQFFLAGLGAFDTVHDKHFKDSNFNAHSGLGDLLVLLALIIAGIALFGRWSRFVTRVSLLLFGLMVLQSFSGVTRCGRLGVVRRAARGQRAADRRRDRRVDPRVPRRDAAARSAGVALSRSRGCAGGQGGRRCRSCTRPACRPAPSALTPIWSSSTSSRRDVARAEHAVADPVDQALPVVAGRRAPPGSGGSCRSGRASAPRTARPASRSRRGRPRTPREYFTNIVLRTKKYRNSSDGSA